MESNSKVSGADSDKMRAQSHTLFILYGIQAGLFACLASVFGKLALSNEDIQKICFNIGDRYEWDLISPCYHISPFIRAACILLIIASNSLMWLFFTKAMNSSATTAAALAVNSAANFLFTGVAGAVVFGESLSLNWLVGTLCIIVGLACIHSSTGTQEVAGKEGKVKTS